MKIALTFILIALLAFAQADVETASTAEDVTTFLETNKENIAALFFIDSSLNEGNEGGFWSGVITSVSHIFSGEDEEIASGQKVSAIEQKISDEADLMQIDVSNEELRQIQEQYDVTTVPFLIIFKKGVLVLKEVPTHETHDKVLQILDINPAAVHGEGDEVEAKESETVESTPEAKEEVASESATAEEKPAEAAPANTEPAKPVRFTIDPKKMERAPVQAHRRPQGPQRPQKQAPPKNPELDREYVHKRCRDVTTPQEDCPPNWKSSPYYIKNLEDYELPEDWWRNGYTPITGNDTEVIHGSRKVKFTEDENIIFEPTDPVLVVPEVRVPRPHVRTEIVTPHPTVRPGHAVSSHPTVRPGHNVVQAPVKRPAHVAGPAPISRPAHVVGSAPVHRPSVIEARLPVRHGNVTVGNSTTSHKTTTAPRAAVKPTTGPKSVARPTTVPKSSSKVTASPVKPTRVTGTQTAKPARTAGSAKPVAPTASAKPVAPAASNKSAAPVRTPVKPAETSTNKR